MKKSDQSIYLLENQLFSSSKKRLLELVGQKVIRTKKPLVIFTPNPEQLVLAQKNSGFQALLNKADYRIPDGIGLVWASRLKKLFGRGEAITERISGIDLATDFLEWAARENWPVLLLGGRGYHQAGKTPPQLHIGGKTAQKLKLQWLEGYENAGAPTAAEERQVAETIRKLKPKLVLVAFGAPKQEQWVIDHLDLLQKSGTNITMVVGGTFDVLFGRLKRAPLWMRSLGLEWLYRLIQEPRRWRRQLALLEFIGLTLGELTQPKHS